ncbi:2OG-Fe(II) oxygenase [Leeia sp. TBRC 13508]|uniref:2OG-Fe(II) oxygenase n=1 Tax=Leeia speluncae TaxID=2884804 RepID=A0ABS8D3L5_9NEIS|nr:2OG-Fe(II) oxygenase [Leeia speluncae]MCB6182789.1 2OG-Fe(II) oxygenase [Leeia speluncae]
MKLDQQMLSEIANKSCSKILGVKEGDGYYTAPFKHIVIDDFLPVELANECINRFPKLSNPCWQHSNDADIEVKYRTDWKSEFDIPDTIVDVVRIMNSAPFLRAMSQVMGIPKIIPDPYFTGGGLNVSMRGGLLDVHVDGNYHDATGLNRRLNALLYLNPGWEESWGGEFGVYDETGTNCIKKVAPLHNRLVIFDSHDKSFHGLPDPINFPEDIPRRSILLYYYTKDARPGNLISVEEPHSALWKKRGFMDKRGNKTRDFT